MVTFGKKAITFLLESLKFVTFVITLPKFLLVYLLANKYFGPNLSK